MITWHEACRQYTMKSTGIRQIENDNEIDDEADDNTFNDEESEWKRIKKKQMYHKK
jgi:hypothetical protein